MKQAIKPESAASCAAEQSGRLLTGKSNASSVDRRSSTVVQRELLQKIANNVNQGHLERDAMITSSPRMARSRQITGGMPGYIQPVKPMSDVSVVQRVIKIGENEYDKPHGRETTALIEDIDENSKSEHWKRGWKGYVREMAREHDVYPYANDKAFIDYLDSEYKDDEDGSDDGLTRPSFPKATYDLARATTSIAKGKDMSKISLSDNNLAALHRMPYADIRDSVVLFATGRESADDLMRWTQRLIDATKQRKLLNLKNDKKGLLPSNYENQVDDQIEAIISSRAEVIKSWDSSSADNSLAKLAPFVSKLNALHGNVPDLGNHTEVNIPVSNRIHPHFVSKGQMSPGSKAANAMTPARIKRGIATTNDGEYVVTTDGRKVPVEDIDTKHKLSPTSIPYYTLKNPDFS